MAGGTVDTVTRRRQSCKACRIAVLAAFGTIAIMAVDEQPGLRERKRRRTRAAIARAALELFDRQGFAETTIPQIADAADVSPRTVSVYFPRKEELALPDGEEAFATLRARLHGRPPEETAADALRAWIGAWLERQEGQGEEELRMRRRVVRSHENLRAYEHRFMLRAQDALAEAYARDLGASAADLEPRIAAAATLAVFSVLGDEDELAAHGPAGSSRAERLALVDRALAFISAGIGGLREP
jgi:AcrR family transcriptional regulator